MTELQGAAAHFVLAAFLLGRGDQGTLDEGAIERIFHQLGVVRHSWINLRLEELNLFHFLRINRYLLESCRYINYRFGLLLASGLLLFGADTKLLPSLVNRLDEYPLEIENKLTSSLLKNV